MGKFVLLLFLFFIPCLLLAQGPIDKGHFSFDTTGKKDLIDIARALIKDKPRSVIFDEKKKIYFSFLPVSTSIPGGGSALVTSTTAGIYLGDPKTTYLSTVTFAPYANLKGRYGMPVRSNIWLSNNAWVIQGDSRFLVYPQFTWGLGGGQPESSRFLVNYNYIRIYQAALKKIKPYFFVGAGYAFDDYIDIENSDNSINNGNTISSFTQYKFGTSTDKNSFSSGPTINLLYDTRKNDLNPLPGTYANVVYRYSGVVFGSNNSWQSLYFDFRKYISLNHGGPKSELAFWSFYWTTLTTGAPYLNLPAIGMDPYNRSGRGFEQNRYRGKRLFDLETEYRGDITHNGLLGFVLFVNVNSASQLKSNRFVYWNPAAGTGLRIKFNKKSDTNICIDYGFSKDYSSVKVGLGEAF
ncbi:hypothetical protein [Mucilaginibacter gotjawali]|uniref:Uncharacterized protein n=2 Tax=Mucilaginibacter gotjawali TaxID=1550579 RepID=A0A839SK73_9SPHI|nr:hypothetical protein [Mucilaginibacter gotjawali]MBB3056877.1 hypothetical protein [Mucilaginibacter gotjawali]BAU55957.1 hypothetical protein MgSA37_04149 [Mucilaginibacter gotjawali]